VECLSNAVASLVLAHGRSGASAAKGSLDCIVARLDILGADKSVWHCCAVGELLVPGLRCGSEEIHTLLAAGAFEQLRVVNV